MNPKVIFFLCCAVGAVAAGPARANLVTNGGFEDNDGTNFIDWIIAGDGISVDSTFPANGGFDAAFATPSADPTPGSLSQTITTTPGTDYTLSLSLMDEFGFPSDSFQVSFGTFSTTLTGDAASSAYTAFSFLVPGADILGPTTTLSFQGINDLSAWNLDDVSVVAAAVPEPSAGALFAAAVLVFLVSVRGRVGARLKSAMTQSVGA